MLADAFRHFYEYHFAENRNTWDRYVAPLPYEQFAQDVGYSRGSIRNQVIHILNTDNAWFSGLRGGELPEPYRPEGFDDRDIIRERWDRVEQDMREYLALLRDEMLFEKPFPEGEDRDVTVVQVLLHVANHGTDHRAQLLRVLNDMGVNTTSQDYIFYVYDHLQDPGS